MRIPGRRTLVRLFRPVANTLRPGGLILGYHRVAETSWDPLGLCVRPARFRQQLDVLRAQYEPVPLRALAEALRRGEDVENLIVLTFDDGYRDFIDEALPVLERLALPATVFVTTGFDGGRFWWSEVAAALDPAEQHSAKLALRWDDAGETREYAGLDSPARAAAVVRELCRDLSALSATARMAIMDQIRRRASHGAAGLASDRAIAESEIRALAATANIEVGSHAVSHSLLGRLTEAEQAGEIAESKRRLEDICGPRDIRGFSYPHGSISAHSRQLLVDAGFGYACTSRQAVVRKHTDVYALPRVWPRDVGDPAFRRWLFSWRGMRS